MKTSRHFSFTRTICLAGFIGLVIAIFGIPLTVRAYVMPSEQLIGLMRGKFTLFRTVVIGQTHRIINSQDMGEDRVVEETLVLRSPDLYALETVTSEDPQTNTQNEAPFAIGVPSKTDGQERDMVFRRLLMSNTEDAITELLSRMGIDLDSVAFTRSNGTIAYRIGQMDPEAPRLLIEKERFVPLILCYRLPDMYGQRMVSVRFGDYRKTKQGWYPHTIDYYVGDEIKAQYTVLRLEINPPVTSRFSEIPEMGFGHYGVQDTEESVPDDKRIQEIQQILKEKYD